MLGRDHAVLRRNRQDAARAGAVGGAVFGVVSDGCGQAPASEVGALLTVAFASAALEAALAAEGPLVGLGERVLGAVLGGLSAVATCAPEARREALVREQLLATLIGFAARGEEVCLFHAGDGALLIDDQLTLLDSDNRPAYPAYALLGAAVGVVERVARSPRRIAVATDGLDEGTLRRLAQARRSSAGLTRALVVAQRGGALADDGALAVAWREVEPCAS